MQPSRGIDDRPAGDQQVVAWLDGASAPIVLGTTAFRAAHAGTLSRRAGLAISIASMAVVGVRAFALGRSAFRYLDRLTSHDAGGVTARDVALARQIDQIAATSGVQL